MNMLISLCTAQVVWMPSLLLLSPVTLDKSGWCAGDLIWSSWWWWEWPRPEAVSAESHEGQLFNHLFVHRPVEPFLAPKSLQPIEKLRLLLVSYRVAFSGTLHHRRQVQCAACGVWSKSNKAQGSSVTSTAAHVLELLYLVLSYITFILRLIIKHLYSELSKLFTRSLFLM